MFKIIRLKDRKQNKEKRAQNILNGVKLRAEHGAVYNSLGHSILTPIQGPVLSGWLHFHDHACIKTTVNVFRIRALVSTMAPVNAIH